MHDQILQTGQGHSCREHQKPIGPWWSQAAVAKSHLRCVLVPTAEQAQMPFRGRINYTDLSSNETWKFMTIANGPLFRNCGTNHLSSCWPKSFYGSVHSPHHFSSHIKSHHITMSVKSLSPPFQLEGKARNLWITPEVCINKLTANWALTGCPTSKSKSSIIPGWVIIQ